MTWLRSSLPAKGIRADLFSKTAYETISTTDRSGNPLTYYFTLLIDHYDKSCRIIDAGGGSPAVPACQCAFVDPEAAARPYGLHLRELVLAGRPKALEQMCAATASPLGPQARTWREGVLQYAEFRIQLPVQVKAAGRKPRLQDEREAQDYQGVKADFERGVVWDKAYNDQFRKLKGVAGPDLEQACVGAVALYTDEVVKKAWDMKVFDPVADLGLRCRPYPAGALHH